MNNKNKVFFLIISGILLISLLPVISSIQITYLSPTPANTSSAEAPVTIVANISDIYNTSCYINFNYNLLGYWNMEYYNETGIYDNSTFNKFAIFNGNLNYSNLTNSSRGKGLDFDGNSSYLDLGNFSLFNPYSISFWVRINNSDELGSLISSNMKENYNFSVDGGFLNVNGLSSTYSLDENIWYHIVTITNSTGTFLYINGAYNNWSSTKTFISNTNLVVGKDNQNNYFNGSIDEIFIIDRNIALTEVLGLYNSKENLCNATYSWLVLSTKYDYNLYIIDELGNFTTEERYFTICDDERFCSDVPLLNSSTILVNLNIPNNYASRSNNPLFNCSATSTNRDFRYSNLYIWNTTSNDLIYNETKGASGLEEISIFDYNFSDSGSYLWNCEFVDNLSSSNFSSSNYTLYINTISPAINLEKPIDEIYINTKNTFFNFTALDVDGLSVCELWTNTTGMWHKNYTWINPISGEITSTIVTLEDNLNYIWNIWCNDTLNNEDFSPNNYTFGLDTIYPNNTIDGDIQTTTGSQTIYFNSTANDNNEGYTCKYSVYNLAGGIDGASQNVSYTCNTQVTASVSAFASYVLQTIVTDIAGNQNWTNKSFIVYASFGGGGGGGGAPIIVSIGNWTMETEFGGSSYEFNMIQSSSRSKDLLFENLGTTSRTIKLTCEPVSGSENLCMEITFDENEFTLPLQKNIKKAIGFNILIPDNYEKGRYVVNLVATDELGNKGIITLSVEVTSYASITGILTKFFSSTKGGIPYFLFFFLVAFMTGVLSHFIIFKPNKLPSALSLVVGLFFGVIFLLLPI